MADLRQTRRKIVIALIALAVVDVVALVVLFSPITGSSEQRRAQLTQTATELKEKTREVVPLRGIDDKIKTARQQIADFYRDRFPVQPSAVTEALTRAAAEHHVVMNQVKYDTKLAPQSGLQPIDIEATFSGKYPDMVRFINALERQKNFFVVNSINLGEAQAGDVRLQMKLEGYTKVGG